jgi:hypothetical protein
MDPGFVERHWAALPNLRRLRDRGSFSRLGTTTPPQSPVAWSTFITGLEPGEHGIFDFVHRDPATLQPFSSMGRTEEARFTLPLGPYVLPLSGSRVISFRRGTAFWQTLSAHGIPVTVIRMPTNYPPVEAGRAVSGMGTPDLRGTLGTFTFYTDDPEELSRSVAGGQIVKIDVQNGRALLPVEGPPNSLRRDHRLSSVNMEVDVDPTNPVARVAVGDETAILREGEWSDWITADFPLIPHLASVHVADGGNVGSAGLIDQAEQILAAFPGSDRTDANPIVRAQNAAVRGCRGKCGAHKDTPIRCADFDGH